MDLETSLVLPLASAQATPELAGGKAAALSRLLRAGFPVPPGFVITTRAYRDYAEGAARASSAAPASQADLPTLESALNSTVQEALIYAYLELGGGPVAVRSSATAEDLPEASFAGQQETFLNVSGETALLEAVQRCWASLWTERAMAYRRRLGIDDRQVAMGVVVQRMVPADIAGVTFTANPSSGARNELLINASYGLGEAIVSGRVTPDTYVLDKVSLELTSFTVGTKALLTRSRENGGTEELPVAHDRGEAQALSSAQLRAVGTLGQQVEALAGGTPQDIEWAIANETLWLLQARPITSLPATPLPDIRWEPPIPGSRWIRRQIVEHMPGPLSPLFDELYVQQGLDRSVHEIQRVMGMSNVIERIMDRPLFATINGYAYMRADVHMDLGALLAYLHAMSRGLPEFFRVAASYWRNEALPGYLALVSRWKAVDVAETADAELLRGIRELAWADARYWYGAALAIGVAKVSDATLDWFLTSVMSRSDLHSGQLLRGIPSRSLAAEGELRSLAERVRASPDLRAAVLSVPPAEVLESLRDVPNGDAVLGSLAEYLERYGHQIYTLDFAEPTQVDDPRPVITTLQSLIERPGEDPARRRAAMVEERRSLAYDAARRVDPIRRRLFFQMLRWAWSLAPLREEALFYLGYGWPTLRRLALKLGYRAHRRGAISSADDVFFLYSSELDWAIEAQEKGEALLSLTELAQERRELRAARARLHPPAAVPPDYVFRLGPLDLSSRESQRRNDPTGSVLNGFPVSPGQVTAPARVILSPEDFGSMTPGSILVCPITTPAWTPLFSQAVGLVTDIGGVLAHGSIVAREYGIPAVMGTGVATQRITSGQIITVNGDDGTVGLSDAPSPPS